MTITITLAHVKTAARCVGWIALAIVLFSCAAGALQPTPVWRQVLAFNLVMIGWTAIQHGMNGWRS